MFPLKVYKEPNARTIFFVAPGENHLSVFDSSSEQIVLSEEIIDCKLTSSPCLQLSRQYIYSFIERETSPFPLMQTYLNRVILPCLSPEILPQWMQLSPYHWREAVWPDPFIAMLFPLQHSIHVFVNTVLTFMQYTFLLQSSYSVNWYPVSQEQGSNAIALWQTGDVPLK